jgi:hypothetical protein
MTILPASLKEAMQLKHLTIGCQHFTIWANNSNKLFVAQIISKNFSGFRKRLFETGPQHDILVIVPTIISHLNIAVHQTNFGGKHLLGYKFLGGQFFCWGQHFVGVNKTIQLLSTPLICSTKKTLIYLFVLQWMKYIYIYIFALFQ